MVMSKSEKEFFALTNQPRGDPDDKNRDLTQVTQQWNQRQNCLSWQDHKQKDIQYSTLLFQKILWLTRKGDSLWSLLLASIVSLRVHKTNLIVSPLRRVNPSKTLSGIIKNNRDRLRRSVYTLKLEKGLPLPPREWRQCPNNHSVWPSGHLGGKENCR